MHTSNNNRQKTYKKRSSNRNSSNTNTLATKKKKNNSRIKFAQNTEPSVKRATRKKSLQLWARTLLKVWLKRRVVTSLAVEVYSSSTLCVFLCRFIIRWLVLDYEKNFFCLHRWILRTSDLSFHLSRVSCALKLRTLQTRRQNLKLFVCMYEAVLLCEKYFLWIRIT